MKRNYESVRGVLITIGILQFVLQMFVLFALLDLRSLFVVVATEVGAGIVFGLLKRCAVRTLA